MKRVPLTIRPYSELSRSFSLKVTNPLPVDIVLRFIIKVYNRKCQAPAEYFVDFTY